MNGPWTVDVSRTVGFSVFRTVGPISGRVLHTRNSPLITIVTRILRPTRRCPLPLRRTDLSSIRQPATAITTLPTVQKPRTSLNPSPRISERSWNTYLTHLPPPLTKISFSRSWLHADIFGIGRLEVQRPNSVPLRARFSSL